MRANADTTRRRHINMLMTIIRRFYQRKYHRVEYSKDEVMEACLHIILIDKRKQTDETNNEIARIQAEVDFVKLHAEQIKRQLNEIKS